tara:strand:- start:18 stop:749 length:732 start_codon:yes stop_codon:yes gene_type:complete
MKTIILFGASSRIAQAYVQHVQEKNVKEKEFHIICISSSSLPDNGQITQYITDYSKYSLAGIIEKIKHQAHTLHQVIIFNGQLHYDQCMPEKKLEDINGDYFTQLMHTNALTPMLCLQSLLPLLNHQTDCTITALSARVGSLKDNELGGWYTYRATKSALNMLFKTAAIELHRRAKKTKLILFHPGTTDTELSKPFQRNVPTGKLFTPAFVAEQLFTLTNNSQSLEYNGDVDYIDWQGKPIDW